MLCSKSIIALHQNRIEEASSNMDSARTLLEELRISAKDDLYKYVAVAEQELVEAYSLKAIMNGSAIPTMEDLQVSGQSYLTGLLDCVGEVKRLVYDRMRSGKEKDVEALFALMQEIYGSVYPFAVYDNVVSGLRKKLDVARMLIEDVRAFVTEEKRRKAMINALDEFGTKLT
jgi:translin